MSDFHLDKRIANSIPNAFAELLQAVCGGRALMNPRKASDRGGALGDLGEFNDGGFTKEFNIYDRSECSLALPKRTTAWLTDQPYTTHMPLVSSHLSHTKFEFDAAMTVPLSQVPPLEVQPKVDFSEDEYEYASLYAYKPAKHDYMLGSEIKAVLQWLTKNYKLTEPTHCVLTSVVRASGWISVYQQRQKRSMSLLGGIHSALGGIGGSASRTVNKDQGKVTRGPEDWAADTTPAEYPIIMRYAQALSRTQRILAGLKISVADSAMGDAPFASEGSLGAAAPPGQPNASIPMRTAPQPPSAEAVDSLLASCSDDVPGNILIGFLQALLDRREDIAVVAGDTSVIMHFVEKYGKIPVTSEVTFVIETQRSDGNTTATEEPQEEIVALIHELVPSDSAAATVVERSLDVKGADSLPSRPPSEAAHLGATYDNSVLDAASNVPTMSSSSSTGSSSAVSAPVPGSQSPVPGSQSAMAHTGFVQRLENYYAKSGVARKNISYSHQGVPGIGYTATVTLSNFNPPGQYTGSGGSIKSAKEGAARVALQALGQTV